MAIVLVAQEQPVIGISRRIDDKPRGIRIADKVIHIDLASANQLPDQRQHEQPSVPGVMPTPFIGNRIVARAHRIDANDLDAPALEF
ncbi:MAG: hypothetical protein R3D29_15800 [Nitratireductor sp.]